MGELASEKCHAIIDSLFDFQVEIAFYDMEDTNQIGI